MKKKNKAREIIMVIIKVIFFFLFPAIFSTAFSGIKSICTQLYERQMIELNPFVFTLICLLGFTIVFGRFFCGFACAFGIYGDVVYEIGSRIRKKMKKKPFQIPETVGTKLKYIKYIVLLLIMILCILGKVQWVNENSIWTVFSQLHALKIPGVKYLVAYLIFLCITIGMVFEKRFFCRFFCPMGAVFSLLPVLPFFAIKRNRENCIKGCRACKMRCPAKIDLPSEEEGDNVQMGECFSCGRCIETCPKGNIHIGVRNITGNEVWLLVVKAVILLGICYVLC